MPPTERLAKLHQAALLACLLHARQHRFRLLSPCSIKSGTQSAATAALIPAQRSMSTRLMDRHPEYSPLPGRVITWQNPRSLCTAPQAHHAFQSLPLLPQCARAHLVKHELHVLVVDQVHIHARLAGQLVLQVRHQRAVRGRPRRYGLRARRAPCRICGLALAATLALFTIGHQSQINVCQPI